MSNKEEEKEETFTEVADSIEEFLNMTNKLEGRDFSSTSNAALFMVVSLFATIILWEHIWGKIFLAIALLFLGYVIHKFAELFSNAIRRLTTISAMFALFSTSYSMLVAAGIERAVSEGAFDEDFDDEDEDDFEEDEE